MSNNGAKNGYLFSPAIDSMAIGGASLLLFPLLMWIGMAHGMADRTALLLVWIINWPHFAATSVQFYRSKQNLIEYPLTAFLLPALLILGITVAFIFPDTFGPAWVKLYSLWSPFHYCAQTLGISYLYAGRMGYVFGKWERRSLVAFVFASMLYPTAKAEFWGPSKAIYYSVVYSLFDLPPVVISIFGVVMLVAAIAFLFLFFARSLAEDRMPNWILLVPAISQFLWFVPAKFNVSFMAFVPAFHCLQYMLISYAARLSGLEPDESAFRPSLLWTLQCVVLGGVLFWGLPRFFGYLIPSRQGVAEPLIIVGVQIHHFILDGIIWKIKAPKSQRSAIAALKEFSYGFSTARV